MEHFILKQKNIPSSQNLMVPSPKLTIYSLGHKTDLSRYKKIEIVPCTLSDHHGLRLVFINNKNNRKPTYTWKLNNTLFNDNSVKEEIKKEMKDFLGRLGWHMPLIPALGR